MAKKDFKKEDAQLESVNEALSTTGQWIERNSNIITWVTLIIAAVALGIIALYIYVIKPKGLAASEENAKAVVYFTEGEWEKALAGDDAECIGFEAIADEYSMYQQGELAALYAGICHYQLGHYQEAADYLKKFSASDLTIDPAAKMLLGDAYVQMDEMKKAADCFKAAAASKNDYIAPIALKKAGLVYLHLEDKNAANKVFNTVKELYPTSAEAADIDKFIALTE
ncbi:MAG: tetratricopeptide repeat protein [Paludibacteraceae bacterium]|nr:tetratricopeptide repeat protein [Paludibacteraceae bacterium]